MGLGVRTYAHTCSHLTTKIFEIDGLPNFLRYGLRSGVFGAQELRYIWVAVNCRGNLTNCGGVACDGLASHPGEVEVLLSASCVCPVIDHEFRHNVVKVAVDIRGDSPVYP